MNRIKYKNRKSNGDQKFYKRVWDSREHKCEECGKYLPGYSATFISHILPKGAYPKLRWNENNINILCLACHHVWEFGDRKSMRVYNVETIEKLKTEYYA